MNLIKLAVEIFGFTVISIVIIVFLIEAVKVFPKIAILGTFAAVVIGSLIAIAYGIRKAV